jgi:diguanylate cyclase (GGDEF)-like protein
VVTEDGLDGVRRVFGFIQLPGTASRLAIGLDASEITQRVGREMRYAYLQLAVIGLILGGALWVGGNRLIVRPIRLLAHMAERFGRGEYEMHAAKRRWAAEFIPLVRAFDEMATKILARRDEARVMTKHLSELATTDKLSGLPNRRAFDLALETVWERARLRGETVALAMIDVDPFKSYNDPYGHVRGDECLRTLGRVLSSAVRTDLDLAARYGGEEFALLLPGLDLKTSLTVAERLRRSVEDRHIPHAHGRSAWVTASVGVASLRPGPQQSARALVEAADGALYAAKHRGRNTVVAHEPVALRAAS